MADDKPFSAACERNREPILEVLREHFAHCRRVLEVGSGTGQHAVHFAAAMPWLEWQCSDRAEHLPGISGWLADASLPNTPLPLILDVTGSWPARVMDAQPFDAVYSANTLHIMGWEEVRAFFHGLGRMFSGPAATCRLAIYGPFNRNGEFTSASNQDFHASLRARDPRMGIRDFEAVDRLAAEAGFALVNDVTMPANNRLLLWSTTAQARTLAAT